MSKTPIYEITKNTFTDWPGNLCCVVWFAKCPLRCQYCYNTTVVEGSGKLSELDLFKFLNKRVNLLDGVVLSGGECTSYSNFYDLCHKIKQLGFKIKIDTSGVNPDIIKSVVNDNLIDYIALDFKALPEKYKIITNIDAYSKFQKTLVYLINNFKDKFEVRTTVHFDLLNEADISKMSEYLFSLGYRNTYYLQKFLNTGNNFGILTNPKNTFDTSKIQSPLKIELRNWI